MTKISVVVYGADVVCASCVNAPTSKDTFEWLQPLLKRKFLNIILSSPILILIKIKRI